MKVFEIAGPVFTGPSADFAPKIAEPAEELTSGADIVLSKNGEQAVRDLKLSDQEVELLKAVALGWADSSDLGDLEQDIFDYWLEANPEDFNPNLHGGGADPSDTIMDELESWFEDAVKEWSKGDTAAADKDSKKVQRTGTHANRKWAVGEDTNPFKKFPQSTKPIKMPSHNEISDEEITRKLDGKGIPSMPSHNEISDEEIIRMLKLAGVKSEAAGKAKPHTDLTTADPDDFSAGGTFDPKPSFGDVEGISKPTPNVDTFSSKFHKSPDWKNIDVTPKKRKNTDPDR